jgi:mono/diheme cytochrome c family protein
VVIYALAFVCVTGLGWYGARLVYGGWSGSSAETAAAPTTPAGSTTKAAAAPAGQRLYASNCASCHPNGGNVIEASLPLKSSKKLADLASFTAFIRSPKMPDGSAGSMPPFPADQLGDEATNELYSYIESMRSSWK